MNIRRTMLALFILAAVSLFNSGCSIINTAIAAGASYGIYQAMK